MKKPPRFHMHLAWTLVSVLAFASTAALAADKTAQQSLMGACNQQAAGKKGDDRRAFMKGCLSDKKQLQQQKMKTCNAGAAGKKGDERKAFMADCLKK